MFHFYIMSNAPETAVIQHPPAGNRKCPLALLPQRSLSPDCRSPSRHLLHADTLQLRACRSESERTANPAPLWGQLSLLPFPLCRITCAHSLHWVSIKRMSSAFLEVLGFGRRIWHFPSGFLLRLCYSCHCTSLWKHSKPKIMFKLIPRHWNLTVLTVKALHWFLIRAKPWQPPKAIPRHNLWTNMSWKPSPVAVCMHPPWSGAWV